MNYRPVEGFEWMTELSRVNMCLMSFYISNQTQQNAETQAIIVFFILALKAISFCLFERCVIIINHVILNYCNLKKRLISLIFALIDEINLFHNMYKWNIVMNEPSINKIVMWTFLILTKAVPLFIKTLLFVYYYEKILFYGWIPVKELFIVLLIHR